MRTKDYEAEYSRTVRIFLASVFLLHILEVEFVFAEIACVSRNIRTAVPAAYGIPVQRSISERDCSHPVFS